MTGSPTRSIFALDGDTNDQIAWDETLFGYGAGDDVLDDDFAALFQGLKYEHLVVIFEQCFSGGMIRDLSQGGSNRLVMSAASEYEFSWSAKTKGNYNEFSFHLTAALNGAEPGGSKVKADTNKDGKVSIVEAFNYARKNDARPETPYYDDNGDGVPHSGKMPKSGDGKLGNKVSLK